MKRNRALAGGARVVTGLAVLAAGALAVTVLSSVSIPNAEASVPSATASTAQLTQHTTVCPGAFGALGLDVTSASDVTPLGAPVTQSYPTGLDATELTPLREGGAPPRAYTLMGGDEAWGAQAVELNTATIRGLAAASCGEASSDQWLVGGGSERGTSSVIMLANPGRVPATVNLTVVDEEGTVEGVGTTGVLVPAGGQKAVSLNGFGAGRMSTAVRVQSSGSPVFATLGVHQITDITPIGADMVNAQVGGATELVFAGVTTVEEHTHTEAEGSSGHDVLTVRLLAPESATTATITGVTAGGETLELATVELEAGVVNDTGFTSFPDTVTALRVTSEVPLVGGVRSLLHNNSAVDFMWMSPSTLFAAGDEVAAVKLAGATVTLVNLGDAEAEFSVGEKTVKLGAAAAQKISLGDAALVTGDAPFALGATIVTEHTMSSYPVLGSSALLDEFTVYTR